MEPIAKESRDAPPFSLLHLLAWVAISAVLTELSRQLRPTSQADWTTVLFAIMRMNDAAGILGLGLRARWWYQKRDVPWQPGHWLLCVVGAMGLWAVATQLALLACTNQELNLPFGAEAARTWIEYVRNIGRLLILTAAVVWMPFRWTWRTAPLLTLLEEGLLRMAGFVAVGSPGWSYLLGAYSASSIGALLAVVLITIWDTVEGPPRDWMHWVGLIAWAMLYIPELLAGPIIWLTHVA